MSHDEVMGELGPSDRGDESERLPDERGARGVGERGDGFAPPEVVEGIKGEVLKALIRALRQEAEQVPMSVEEFSKGRAEAWAAGGLDYYEEVRRFEVALITWALSRTEGHQTAAARLLGMSVSTLNTKVKQFHIPVVRTTPA